MNRKLLIKLILISSRTSLLAITSLVISLQPSLAQSTPVNRLPTQAPTSPPLKNPISQTPPSTSTPTTPTTPEPSTPTPTTPTTPIRPNPASHPDRTIPNYIGVGPNIGLSGDTALSESAFTIFSKIRLTNNFSFRPAGVFSNKAVILLPITFDFPVNSGINVGGQQINFVPFIGVGAAIATNQDSTVGVLLTGGVDVRLSREFTATAGVNAGFLDRTNVGLMLGIGYHF